jgi:ubiquinone/menaquinone biosynthesis C-methylase UbiE
MGGLMTLDESGEYFIPGRFAKRLEDEHLERYRFASQFVTGKSVLDIACGVGYGSRMLLDAGAASVIGVDLGNAMIESAQQNYQTKNLQYIVGDITTFGEAASCDIVISFETIEHINDYRAALRNLYRILKPGGTLILSTPNRSMSWRPVKTINDKPRNPYHVREFSLDEIVETVSQAGYRISKYEVFGQRQYLYIANRYIRKLFSILFHPEDRSSAVVKPLMMFRRPKYVVLVARKDD